jgi:ceramide synthetase
MLGNGYMSNMFLKGFPDSYFYERTPLFTLYYNINLAYFLNDFIFMFIMERQSDFINMLLHHVCTISLIIFSFITNYSNIGSLVLFCHMESDILVHLARFLLQTDNSIFIIGFVGVIFTINFVYMRQYVFGEIIYTIYKYITWKWRIITTTLWLFLVILYIMHLRWSYVLLSKISELLVTQKKVEDEVNYDKLVKVNKKDNGTDIKIY